MKKKITLIASMFMLTGSMFYFSGCKKTVENLLEVECFKCTHPTDSTLDEDDVCNAAGLTAATDVYTAQLYTCTKK